MTTTEDPVLVERSGPIGRLIFNRPDKSNAMTFDDAQFLTAKLHELEDDDDIKVIILKGNGKSFCAGHDFDDVVRVYGLDRKGPDGKQFKMSQRARLQIDRRLAEEYMAFQYSHKPVIAQVQGAAVGFGMYLTELVDMVVCADNARFSHAEQRLGFAGNTWHLNMQILTYGPKKVRELLLFGSQFDGKDAERMGLANISVPEDELEATAEKWAERVARNPKDALVLGKAMHQMALDSLGASQQFIRGVVGHTLGTGLSFEKDEFNFFRERRDTGTKQAYRNRDASYETEKV
ncbi:enoyl-CoA hydratase/isomerase family protein [Arthrobacter sp. ISL-69]|uniref:enoyl-CoA hydratase/isomerase family protein n=1 Tax=Arthrobacter sp. ISL-69 TaxID=2819113 RepID=UPI001BE7AF4F|nr:enoyl-CoA hydratase/isomerase family protein [Arthrobacter sp. ISL-69]MBT2535476.1 enoyl-CoA hydratase/isomerase family protein [Arthrobacter sp. ISL-69]